MNRTATALAYAIAALLWGLVGALLLTDRAVPLELYGAASVALGAAGVWTRRPGDVSQEDAGELVAEALTDAATEPRA
jgi:hypothetical protein